MTATAGTGTSTRDDKSRRTKQLLLDATIDSIIEIGYARTSMQELCTRAGVSRGAQLHHFPTKAKIMAAAVEQLADKQLARVRERTERVPVGERRVEVAVDLMLHGFTGRLAQASLELWIAARTDPELLASLAPVERELTQRTKEFARGLMGDAIDEQAFETLFGLTVLAMRGIALDEILHPSSVERDRLIEAWRELAARVFAAPEQ